MRRHLSVDPSATATTCDRKSHSACFHPDYAPGEPVEVTKADILSGSGDPDRARALRVDACFARRTASNQQVILRKLKRRDGDRARESRTRRKYVVGRKRRRATTPQKRRQRQQQHPDQENKKDEEYEDEEEEDDMVMMKRRSIRRRVDTLATITEVTNANDAEGEEEEDAASDHTEVLQDEPEPPMVQQQQLHNDMLARSNSLSMLMMMQPLEETSADDFFFVPPPPPPPPTQVTSQEEKAHQAFVESVLSSPVEQPEEEDEKKQASNRCSNNTDPEVSKLQAALQCAVCSQTVWQPVAHCCIGVLMCRLCAMCLLRDAGGEGSCSKCDKSMRITDLHVITQLDAVTEDLVSPQQRVDRVVAATERFSGHVSISASSSSPAAATLMSSPTTMALMRLCVAPEAQERHWPMLSGVLRDHMSEEASFTKDDIICKQPPVRLAGPTGAKLTVCHPRGAQLASVSVSVLLDVMSKMLV